MYDLLLEGAELKPLALGEYISLLPANIDLAAAEIQLPTKRNQERTLARMLKRYSYDYILIDCPPSLGVLTTNALTAANLVIVPVTTELMAERTIKLILNTIQDVKESELNTTLKVWRILPSLHDIRLAHHKEIGRIPIFPVKEKAPVVTKLPPSLILPLCRKKPKWSSEYEQRSGESRVC